MTTVKSPLELLQEWVPPIPDGWEVAPAATRLPTRKIMVEPSALDSETVFHYSIPAFQKTGDGIEESVADIESHKILLRGDELLVSRLNPRKGTVLLAEKHDVPTVCSSEFVPLIPSGCERKFAYYLYTSLPVRSLISSTVESVTRSHQRARPESIAKIPLPWPPLVQQRAIVRFLDEETAKIDTLVEKKRRLLHLLDEQWLTTLSAVTNSGRYQERRLRSLVKEPLKYGLGELAQGARDEGVRMVRITDVDSEGKLRDDVAVTVEENAAAPYLLEEGDVLLARSGATVGKSFFYSSDWGRACFAGYLIRARLHTDELIPKWFYYFTRSPGYWKWIKEVQIQATIPNVSADRYGGLMVPLPSLREQQQLVEVLEAAAAGREQARAKISQVQNKLVEYRLALITAAVTGQIDVRSAA